MGDHPSFHPGGFSKLGADDPGDDETRKQGGADMTATASFKHKGKSYSPADSDPVSLCFQWAFAAPRLAAEGFDDDSPRSPPNCLGRALRLRGRHRPGQRPTPDADQRMDQNNPRQVRGGSLAARAAGGSGSTRWSVEPHRNLTWSGDHTSQQGATVAAPIMALSSMFQQRPQWAATALATTTDVHENIAAMPLRQLAASISRTLPRCSMISAASWFSPSSDMGMQATL